jgi:hypothetical protein
VLLLDVRAEVHPGAVPPAEEGLPASMLALMNSLAAATVSSSIVSIRFLVSGPRFSMVCPPLPSALHLSTPRGPKVSRKVRPSGQLHVPRVVAVLRFFLGVQMVEAAKEFIEAVHGGQVLVAVALMVLAELARGVALALQDRRDRESVFCQPCGAPGSPTLVMPVRTGTLPLMNAARPAVQLCWA